LNIDELLGELEFVCDLSKGCVGLYFRYSKSYFLSKYGSIEKRESYRILTKRSCNGGCGPKCIKDCFDYDIEMVGFNDVDIVYPENPQNGDIYCLRFVAGKNIDETGCVDEWSWVLEKVQDLK